MAKRKMLNIYVKVKISNAYRKSKNLLNFVLVVFVWFLENGILVI